MLTRTKRRWELPESAATPEGLFLSRRKLIKSVAAGSIIAAGGGLLSACDEGDVAGTKAAEAAAETYYPKDDPSLSRYPVERNPKFVLDRPITEEKWAATFNNFYEFGSSKNIWEKAQALPIRPWTVQIAGMVDKPFEIAIDDLLGKMPLEERLYRHRCVEAWSMAVPWSGFPLRSLVELAQPLSGAKFLKMVTFKDEKVAPGQKAVWYPWPYVEGLTMEEARHDLSFIVTGAYGKPLPKQNGSPLRLAVPWKYGFKHIKSIVRFEFTDQRPVSFWEEIQGSEYGFWANINPAVPHPRWSQASERILGSDERKPTLLYNGYAEEVAGLYADLEAKGEPIFM